MQWNQENVLKLIELYRSKEILWDPTHKQYFNKILKHDAFVEISKELNDVSVDELKKKIDNLLAQFRREKAKMEKTTGQGADELYRSSWYAFDYMTFLLERNTPRIRINTEDWSEKSSDDTTALTEEINMNDINNSQHPHDVEEQIEHHNTENQNTSISQNTTSTRKSCIRPPLSKINKVNKSNSQMIHTAYEILSSATAAAKEASTKTLDNSQAYGNYIASKLRSYSRHTKNLLQHHISNLLFQADSGYFEDNQPSFSYPSTSQSSISPRQFTQL